MSTAQLTHERSSVRRCWRSECALWSPRCFTSGSCCAGRTQLHPATGARPRRQDSALRRCRRSKRRRCSNTSRCWRPTSSRAARRARPAKRRTVQYLDGEFKKLGLKPGNTDGTYIQKVPLVGITGAEAKPLVVTGKARAHVQVARRGGGVDQARRRRRQHREFRHRLRRLRRRGAGVQLGRLQGRRRQGQDDRRARQRSRRFPIRRTRRSSIPDVRRQGDDLLRPLDLQVREGGADGRGRRAHRPRDRAGRLSVHRRAGQPRREVRPRHAGQEHGPREHRGLADARRREADPARWPGRTSTR